MKQELRQDILKKRNNLTSFEIKGKSEKIKQLLFSLPEYKNSKKILYYVSFGSEVNTHNMIKESLKTKKVVVPKIKEQNLILSRIYSFSELSNSSYNILEPVKTKRIDEKKIDLIIVPGIAFDKKGNRIGYGKGYYDKLLKKLNAKKIALSFEMQLINNIPKQKHDVSVDMIISEKKIYNC